MCVAHVLPPHLAEPPAWPETRKPSADYGERTKGRGKYESKYHDDPRRAGREERGAILHDGEAKYAERERDRYERPERGARGGGKSSMKGEWYAKETEGSGRYDASGKGRGRGESEWY